MKIFIILTLFFCFSFEAHSEGYNPTHLFKKDKCTQWAKNYKARVAKLNKSGLPPTLNIAFEGLGSYNERRTRNFYASQQGLTGRNVGRSRSRAGSSVRGGRGRMGESGTAGVRRGGFFSRLSNRRVSRRSLSESKLSGGSPFGFGALVKRFLKKAPKNTNAEYLVLPHTAYNRKNQAKKNKLIGCIVQFKRENPEVKINIIGHSFGGAAAKELEKDLHFVGKKKDYLGLAPNHTLTFDPRDREYMHRIGYGCYSNTCANYRQKAGFLPGARMTNLPPRSRDFNLTGKYGHGNLPASGHAARRFLVELGYGGGYKNAEKNNAIH